MTLAEAREFHEVDEDPAAIFAMFDAAEKERTGELCRF